MRILTMLIFVLAIGGQALADEGQKNESSNSGATDSMHKSDNQQPSAKISGDVKASGGVKISGSGAADTKGEGEKEKEKDEHHKKEPGCRGGLLTMGVGC